jgi:plasmid stability protein
VDVATLYVRNLPADLYDELRHWADAHGRSVNAEVIEILRRESDRRGQQANFAQWLAEYRRKYGDQPIAVPDVVELIHEGRDREWYREYGI